MLTVLNQLNNREISILIYLIIFSIFVLLFERKLVFGTLKFFTKESIPTILLSTIAYFFSIIYILVFLGFWEIGLLKVSFLWLITVGFVSVLSIDKDKLSDNSLLKFIVNIFTLSMVFQFLISTYVFGLGVELILNFIFIVIGASIAFTETKVKPDGRTEYTQFRNGLDIVLGLLIVTLIVYTLYSFIFNPNVLLNILKLKEFILPIVLSIAFSPLYYFVICFACYEVTFNRLGYKTNSKKLNLVTKLYVIATCRFSVNKLNKIEDYLIKDFKFDQKSLRKAIRSINFRRTTGLYSIIYKRLKEITYPKHGSINQIGEYLGYEPNQVQVVHAFDSKIFEFIGFKILTKKPIFAKTRDGVKNLHYSSILEMIDSIDWKFEYSPDFIEDILNEGIALKNLSFRFLNMDLELEKIDEKIYFHSAHEIELQFENDLLTGFKFINNLGSASKWLRDTNTDMFRSMLAEAKKFQPSDKDAYLEVELQCESFMSIPNVINNEYIKQHLTAFGNVNFYNLRAAHYQNMVHLDEFLKINNGRYVKINDRKFKIRSFVYHFNSKEELINVKKVFNMGTHEGKLK